MVVTTPLRHPPPNGLITLRPPTNVRMLLLVLIKHPLGAVILKPNRAGLPKHGNLLGTTLPKKTPLIAAINRWFSRYLAYGPPGNEPASTVISARRRINLFLQVRFVLLVPEKTTFLLIPPTLLSARQQPFKITLRDGAMIGPLLPGPKTPRVVSTNRCVLVRVLLFSGMRMVTRLLLKLVPQVLYINGRRWTVPFLISIGLNVRTFKWRSAGVWPSNIGRLSTILLNIL